MTATVILIVYVFVVALGLRARHSGIKIFYLLAYVVNVTAIFWLLFMFFALSQGGPQGTSTSTNLWVVSVCLLLAFLLIPFTISSLARGERSGQHEITPEQLEAAREEFRRQYPASIATLTIAIFWMVFIGMGTFEFLRFHIWQIVLGIVASAVLGWIIVNLFNRRRISGKGAA